MMNAHSKAQVWYREPGVWLLISPLLLVFAVCSVLIYFAVIAPDDRVSDDYYKQGKLINHRFAAEQRAEQMGLEAKVNLDTLSGEVFLTLSGEPLGSDTLRLFFSHPAQAAQDFSLKLSAVRTNVYRGELPAALTGRWYVRLEPEVTQQNPWRLKGSIAFQGSQVSFYLE